MNILKNSLKIKGNGDTNGGWYQVSTIRIRSSQKLYKLELVDIKSDITVTMS